VGRTQLPQVSRTKAESCAQVVVVQADAENMQEQ
jgi:hypothetical protein